MKLDTIDRGVQDAIIQARRWSGGNRRPFLGDSNLPTGRVGRNLPSAGLYNNLDSGSGFIGPDSFSRPRLNRDDTGYGLSL